MVTVQNPEWQNPNGQNPDEDEIRMEKIQKIKNPEEGKNRDRQNRDDDKIRLVKNPDSENTGIFNYLEKLWVYSPLTTKSFSNIELRRRHWYQLPLPAESKRAGLQKACRRRGDWEYPDFVLVRILSSSGFFPSGFWTETVQRVRFVSPVSNRFKF